VLDNFSPFEIVCKKTNRCLPSLSLLIQQSYGYTMQVSCCSCWFRNVQFLYMIKDKKQITPEQQCFTRSSCLSLPSHTVHTLQLPP
jgi:hypothetical protein